MTASAHVLVFRPLIQLLREAERPQRQPGQGQPDPFDAQRVHGADDDGPAARPLAGGGTHPCG